jgi:hypothetical protein
MNEEDDIVLTPAGPRSRSQVHAVGPGSIVRRTEEGTYVVVAEASGEHGGEVAVLGEELVLTPGGLRPKSLVHRLEPGTILDGRGGRYRQLGRRRKTLADFGSVPFRPAGRPLMPRNVFFPVAGPTPAFGSGWITYASWSNGTGTPVSRFATTWVVPPAPSTQSGQTIFLFNGIQNATMIYQPVLQWGPSAAGGGNFWSAASWYADGQTGQSFHSTLVNVNAGDVLVGVMTLTGQSPAGFSYNCEFQGIANTGLPVQNIAELTWCVETLEAYGITRCSDYPDTDKTAMTSIDLRTGATQPNVVWTVTDSVTDCGQHTLRFDDDAVGHGEVDLWYRGGPFWTAGAGTIGPGETQEWWFSWGGVGDVGPQLIQAEPLNASAELTTTQISETLDANGHLTYFATVRNDGPNTVSFQWRGGGF